MRHDVRQTKEIMKRRSHGLEARCCILLYNSTTACTKCETLCFDIFKNDQQQVHETWPECLRGHLFQLGGSGFFFTCVLMKSMDERIHQDMSKRFLYILRTLKIGIDISK